MKQVCYSKHRVILYVPSSLKRVTRYTVISKSVKLKTTEKCLTAAHVNNDKPLKYTVHCSELVHYNAINYEINYVDIYIVLLVRFHYCL
jgi:hypothetical protein